LVSGSDADEDPRRSELETSFNSREARLRQSEDHAAERHRLEGDAVERDDFARLLAVVRAPTS
jgi:hypothetical protein